MPQPFGLCLDPDGDLLISSEHSIRSVNLTTGIITTVAGGNGLGFSGDDGPAVKAQITTAQAITTDAAGNLFIADAGNHRVRRVDHATGIITTVVGDGKQGYIGDGEIATGAEVSLLMGIAVDGAGNLFFAYTNNHRVRRVQMAPVKSVINKDQDKPQAPKN